MQLSWHVKDEFLRLFVDANLEFVFRNDDLKLNPVCFACQHKLKTLVLYSISSITRIYTESAQETKQAEEVYSDVMQFNETPSV